MKNIILNLFNILFAIGIIISTKETCNAQNIMVSANANQDSVLVGKSFDYKLEVRVPKDYIIDWSTIGDTLSKNIEIINKGEISVTPVGSNGKDILVSQPLTLISFDTGYVEIPRIGLKYLKSADDTSSMTAYSNSSNIYVKGVSIDTTMAYKNIKMPIKQNITFKETTPFIGGGIILAALILLIIFIAKRLKKKDVAEEEQKILIPAITTAREKLNNLKESNLCQSGRFKEYYTDLTDIVREYLEGQFNIGAVEMTSDEIMEEVQRIKLDNNLISKLRDCLQTSDLVKFAKASPDSSYNEAVFNDISNFVEESYTFYLEEEKRKAEEAKSKKINTESSDTDNQEMEETK